MDLMLWSGIVCHWQLPPTGRSSKAQIMMPCIDDLKLSKHSTCPHEPAPIYLPVGVVQLCMVLCEFVHLKGYLFWFRRLAGCYGGNIH